jgi:hypothetical protein
MHDHVPAFELILFGRVCSEARRRLRQPVPEREEVHPLVAAALEMLRQEPGA